MGSAQNSWLKEGTWAARHTYMKRTHCGLSALLPWLLGLLFFSIQACERAAENTAALESSRPFFDLETYIDQELASLARQGKVATKRVRINGEEETQRLVAIDFEKDLRAFRKAAINRPAWRDKYRVSREGQEEVYQALDSSLQTQSLRILRNEAGDPIAIHIMGKSGSVLSRETKELHYEPGKGYRISSRRNSQLIGDADVDIQVVF